jgi:hypothetical protein
MKKKKLEKRLKIVEWELEELRNAYFSNREESFELQDDPVEDMKILKGTYRKFVVRDKNPLTDDKGMTEELNKLVKQELAKDMYSNWLIDYIERMKKESDVKFTWKEDGHGLWTFSWSYPPGYWQEYYKTNSAKFGGLWDFGATS